MSILSYFDIVLVLGIMILSLYCLKNYKDRQKKWEDSKLNAKYHNFSAETSFSYREWKRDNRNITFFLMPFMAAVVYIVLRLNGTIDNIFL